MSIYKEYTYESEERHLSEDEALEKYRKAKRKYPNAIIVLKDLPCGHWDIEIYLTREQKANYYKKKKASLFKQSRKIMAL